MAKKYVIALSEAERAWLRTLIGRGAAPARLLAHARILLKADQGEAGPSWPDAAIAGAVEVGLATVARVRQAYATAGLDAALRPKVPARVLARGKHGSSRWRVARRRPGASTGACGSWRSIWCGWRWSRRSRMRRCGGP